MNVCCSENINKPLAHQVTKEYAKTLPIGRVVELAVHRYSNEEGEHLQALYSRVKGEFSTQKMVLLLSCAHIHTCTDGYNQYVRLSGGTTSIGVCSALQGRRIYTISDDIPLLHFLSGKLMTRLIVLFMKAFSSHWCWWYKLYLSGANDWIFFPTDKVDQEESNDRLYNVAADIIAAHNTFIEEVYCSARAQHLSHFLPDEPQRVYPSEVSDLSCIVGKLKRWEYF